VPLTREIGGAKGTRTPNPLLAKQVRYLLRHGPVVVICPSRRAFGPRPRVVHPALTPSCVCTVGAIRLAAPFHSVRGNRPDQVTIHVGRDRDHAWPSSLETTAISAPEASISEAAQCLRPWKLSGGSGLTRPFAERLEQPGHVGGIECPAVLHCEYVSIGMPRLSARLGVLELPQLPGRQRGDSEV
jgi:hypothetical protein